MAPRASWPTAPPEVALNLYAVVKKAEDPDLASVIMNGVLEQYTWSLNREAEGKWTCDSGNGAKVLKDCTDAYGLELVSSSLRLSIVATDLVHFGSYWQSQTEGTA